MTYVDDYGVERYVRNGGNVLAERAAKERWRKANPEKHRARNDRWRLHNPEKQSASEKLWRDANPEAVRAKRHRSKHKRRARIEEAGADVIDAEFLRCLRVAQRDGCAYCGTPLGGGGELDHVTPVSRGGRHTKVNLAWTCMPCNRTKSDRLGWVPFSLLNNLPAKDQSAPRLSAATTGSLDA